MAFKVGEQAYIIENNSRVTPVVVVRSYGDFYTVAFGEKGINLRASRLFRTKEEAEKQLPRRVMAGQPTGDPGYASAFASSQGPSPYDYMDYRSPYGI